MQAKSYGAIGFSAVILILIAILSFQNGASVTLVFFGATFHAPLGAVSFGTFAMGVVVAGLSLLTIRQSKQQVSEQKQLEWQKQDEKLEKEKESDRVKQLEAKIDTLETALKAALARRK